MVYISDNSILCNNLKPRYEIWEDASNEKFMQYYLGGISRLIWFNVVHRLRVMTRQLDQVWEDAKADPLLFSRLETMRNTASIPLKNAFVC